MATIIRVQKNKDNPFVMIDKRPLENPSMTWQAKGMLAYLLSKPDDWEINMRHLIKQSKNGRDATYTIMGELISSGHCGREKVRDDGGKVIGTEYTVSETPLPGKPDTAKPDTVKPDTENQDINKIDSTKNEKANKIEVTNTLRVRAILAAWAFHFPDKPLPKSTTKSVQDKVRTRFKNADFVENWELALSTASKSPTLQSSSWFNLAYFLRNDDNYQKCIDQFMSWKDDQQAQPQAHVNVERQRAEAHSLFLEAA